MSGAEEFRLLAREERMELRLVAGLATGGLQFYSQPQLGGGGEGLPYEKVGEARQKI